MPYHKVTFIDDLPELNQLENENEDKVRRFVRKNQNMEDLSPQSGMPTPPAQRNYVPKDIQRYTEEPAMFESNQQMILPPEEIIINPQEKQLPVLYCQDVFYHVSDCPICKKIYKNDVNMYLIVIAILVLMCALLFKKVLGV
jgi:hypothetical protein